MNPFARKAESSSHRLVKVFAIFDSKAEAYSPTPLFYETTGLALRAFEKGVNTDKTGLSEYPADYTLFEIGTYDLDTAEIKMLSAHRSLGTALEFKKSSPI